MFNEFSKRATKKGINRRRATFQKQLQNKITKGLQGAHAIYKDSPQDATHTRGIGNEGGSGGQTGLARGVPKGLTTTQRIRPSLAPEAACGLLPWSTGHVVGDPPRPALRGYALPSRRWLGSRAPCVLTYY